MDELKLHFIVDRIQNDKLIYDDALFIKQAIKELNITYLQFCAKYNVSKDKIYYLRNILRMSREQYLNLVNHGIPEQVILKNVTECRGTSENLMRRLVEVINNLKNNNVELTIDSYDTFESGLAKINVYLKDKLRYLPSPENGTVIAVHNIKESITDLERAYNNRGR